MYFILFPGGHRFQKPAVVQSLHVNALRSETYTEFGESCGNQH
jgi:hypothetical protein